MCLFYNKRWYEKSSSPPTKWGARALDLDRRTLNHNQTCHSQIPLMRGICLVPFYRTVRVGRLSEIDTAWQSTSKYAFRYPRECALFLVPSCLLRLFCLWYLFGWPSKWEKLPFLRGIPRSLSTTRRVRSFNSFLNFWLRSFVYHWNLEITRTLLVAFVISWKIGGLIICFIHTCLCLYFRG